MKISKREGAILLTASLFVAFTAGWFLHSASAAQPIRVETERTLTAAVAVPPSAPSESGRESIDLNTATAEQLQTLPGIGEKRAADIIADREQNGPYRYPEDITRVKGIGEATMKKILNDITVED